VIGRDDEIDRVMQTLSRRPQNNPSFWAKRASANPPSSKDWRKDHLRRRARDPPEQTMITLDLALMVAGTKYRGQFEERIKAVMDEIRRTENISCSWTSCTRSWAPAAPRARSTRPIF